MNASELYKELGILTKDKSKWEENIPYVATLLNHESVRMEAPEIFRVLGKRRPEFVRSYIGQLKKISETDSNRVVRIHALGAIKAADAE